MNGRLVDRDTVVWSRAKLKLQKTGTIVVCTRDARFHEITFRANCI